MDIDAVRVLQGNATLPPPTMTVHPGIATITVPPTSTPLGTPPNLSVKPNQPLVPQFPSISPSPAATGVPNSVSTSTGIITPVPTIKGLIFSGQESSAPNNLFTVNPIVGDMLLQLTNIPTAPGFNYPVWSPDGKSVAFSDASGQLQILNVATGTYSAPSTTAITIAGPVAWDPSGSKRIAYIDGSSYALKVVDFSASTAVIISLITATSTGTGYSQVSWNKSANIITFQSVTAIIESVSAACIPSGVCTAGPALDSGANSAISSDPAWSPDGTKLAYVSNRDGQTSGNNDVYVFDLVTSTNTKVSSGTTSKQSPSWNYNGSQLVYVDSQTAINLVDKANTATPISPVTVANATVGSLLSVSWSSLYVGPPTTTPMPSATPVTLTGATLTSAPLLPNVGDTVIFTFTVINSSSFVLTNPLAQLQVSGTTIATPIVPTLAAPTTIVPGATVVYTFSHVVTASDSCSLSPVAVFSSQLPNTNTITEVVSGLTNGTVINVQRIGLVTAGVLPISGTTAIGQTLTTSINVVNSGCLSEVIVGHTMINNVQTSDPVTSSGQSTLALPVGNAATFTSTHTVTSSDFSSTGTIGVVVAYTFNATASTNAGTALTLSVVSSSTTYTAISVGIINPMPTLKALIYGGEESSSLTVNNLFTVNPIAGDTPVQVTNGAAGAGLGVGYNYPVWSPDGKSVAFYDANYDLRILDVSSGTVSPPYGISHYASSVITWDPSGTKQIAYVDWVTGMLSILDLRGVSPIYNTIPVSGAAASMVSWNKNANIITYEAPVSSSGTPLESVRASCVSSCTPTSALDPGANSAINSDPAWSPDGTKLAYVSNRDGQTNGDNDVYVFDPATNTNTKVSSGTSSKRSPSWNYNGTQLVYVDSQTSYVGQTSYVNIQTSIEMVDKANTTSPATPVLIHTAIQGSLTSVSWSPLYIGPPASSPTPIAITTGSLMADNLTPNVGAAVTFTFSVMNTTSYPLTSILAKLTVNGGTAVPLSSTTAATPTAMAPGTTATFKFVYTTTATDTCSLTPYASFSGTLTGVNQSPVTFTTSQLTNTTGAAQTINVQRIGLTTNGVLPSSGNPVVGQILTTTINVTNSGCLPELITGYTLVNNAKTTDPVTNNGSTNPPTLTAGSNTTFTSTHTVTSSDFSTGEVFPNNNGLALVSMTHADRVDPNHVVAHAARATTGVVIAYTFNATGSTVNGTPLAITIVSSGTTYSSSVTATPGTGTGSTSTTLGLTKTASVSSIGPGGSFNYTITVTNNTGGTISALSISDSLPTNVTSGTVTVNPTTCPSTIANGSLTVTCSSLAAAQTVSVTIPVTVAKSVTVGTSISNTANASYSGGNATPSTVSVAVANGATSLPVTGYGNDSTPPFMLIALIVLIIGTAVVGAQRYTTTQRTGGTGQ